MCLHLYIEFYTNKLFHTYISDIYINIYVYKSKPLGPKSIAVVCKIAKLTQISNINFLFLKTNLFVIFVKSYTI